MARPTDEAAAAIPPSADSAESKSAQTRRRILDAAAHVLSTKGYAGLRLNDVAAQAELQAPAKPTPGTLDPGTSLSANGSEVV